MNLRKAADMALEVLEANNKSGWYSQEINTLKKALEQPEQEPIHEGWQFVPIEPTAAMIQAMYMQLTTNIENSSNDLYKSYAAMLAAAPKPEDV